MNEEEINRRWRELLSSHPALDQLICQDDVLHAAACVLVRQPEWSLTRALGEMLKCLVESKREVMLRFSGHLTRCSLPTIAGCALLPVDNP